MKHQLTNTSGGLSLVQSTELNTRFVLSSAPARRLRNVDFEETPGFDDLR